MGRKAPAVLFNCCASFGCAYRFTGIWSSLFTVLAFYFNYRVFRYWKRLGGDTDYVPPTTKFRYEDLPRARNTKTARGLLYLIFLPTIIAGIPINIFWLYYYHSVMKHPYNFKVYIILTVVGYAILPFYIRFFKYMERE